MTSIKRNLAALLLAGAAALPAFGQADLTRMVWLGDSIGAGVSNGCLSKHTQIDSIPAIVARQAGAADFQQPIIEEPGQGGCLVLTSLAPSFSNKPSTGVPSNLNVARPYNNLSIPGCAITDYLRATTASEARPGFCAGLIDLVLRNQALHIGSMVDQAVALNPTFVVLEDVGNNYLGAVLSGTVIDGVTVQPVQTVTDSYTQALQKLSAKQRNGFVSTNVNVTQIPFATTLPPVLTSGGQVVLVNGQPIPLLGPKGCPAGVPACPVPAGTLVTLQAAGFLPTGFGIPCAAAPSLPNCNKPLPDSANTYGPGTPGVLLYPDEVALLQSRHDQYNAAIRAAAAATGYKVFDTDAAFDELKAGVHFGGLTVNAAFLTGGAFSYDGIHLTSIGYAWLADKVVQFINANFGNNIPRVDMSVFLFNGNTTGIMGSPIIPAMRTQDVYDAAARIFTPEYGKALMRSYAPQLIPALDEIPVSREEPVQHRRDAIEIH